MTTKPRTEATGLAQLLEFIAAGDRSPMSRTMNMHVSAAGDGWAEVTATPLESFYNPMNRVHGGFAATLLDSALGCAVMTRLPRDTGYGTVELKVNYVRKIEVASGPLVAHATVLHSGRTMLTAEAKVADAAGLLYAHGSGTFLVYPKQ